jgi:hypothetical protein
MRPNLRHPDAETVALKALAWLMNSESSRDRFLNETGAVTLNLRESALQPEFLGAVMDFLMSDEVLAAGFCEDESLSAEALFLARHALPGAA